MDILERIKEKARTLERLTASSESVNIRSLFEDEPESKVESIDNKTDHKPDQFFSTLLTTVKDDTDHKPDPFLSILSTHSISGIIGQNAERSSVDYMTVGQGTPAKVLDTPGIEGKYPKIVQEKETDLSTKPDPVESNSTEFQKTSKRGEDLKDELELTTEDGSDSHQRQTQKCFSYEEYSNDDDWVQQ